MKNNYTHIDILIDKSGSMNSLRENLIDGINSFLDKQKSEKGKCTVSMTQFDFSCYSKNNFEYFGITHGISDINKLFLNAYGSCYDTTHDFVDINIVSPLNSENYIPRGSTAYFDALGKRIDDLGMSLSKLNEEDRPEKIVFVIWTDGKDNASLRYCKSQIKEKISHQREKYNWQFVFLGANMDAATEGSEMGIVHGMSAGYAHNSFGVNSAWESVSDNVLSYRTTGDAKVMKFTDVQVSKMKGD